YMQVTDIIEDVRHLLLYKYSVFSAAAEKTLYFLLFGFCILASKSLIVTGTVLKTVSFVSKFQQYFILSFYAFYADRMF
ncbi:MAG: hypothetical protein KAQ64_05320, partial [Candidatus Pacebacteria bacterium]|nr:hypothetical protein [Candidatus Paceibacterota bacterium]